MTAAQIRTDNGMWVAILLLLIALVASVGSVIEENWYECKEGGGLARVAEWEPDEVPWYGAHPWLVP